MNRSDRIDFDLMGIARVLKVQPLAVPPYQRNFSWEFEQVDAFWFDLRAALASDQQLYFLGTIVLGEKIESRATIIDGQQRLTTASLLLASAYHALLKRSEFDRARAIKDAYLSDFSLATGEAEATLLLNPTDRATFERLLERVENPPTGNRQLLISAADRIETLLEDDLVAAGPLWLERLLKWITLLEDTAKVIVISVTNDSDAFVIFETFNDRGKALSIADLIKNYLLSLSREDLDEAQRLWADAVREVEEYAFDEELTSLVRMWWTLHNGATRERDLYASIRRNVSTKSGAIAALKDLSEIAPHYAALLDLDHPRWEDLNSAGVAAIRTFRRLGLEQYRPLALAALHKLGPDESLTMLRATLNWSVRAMIAGSLGGGTAERIFAEGAVRVEAGRARAPREVFEPDRESGFGFIVPADSSLIEAFSKRSVLRPSTAWYLLAAICADDPLVDHLSSRWTVAPLIPQVDLSGSWRELVGDDFALARGRLGNLGLFERGAKLPAEPSHRLEYFSDHDLLNNVGGHIEGLDIGSIDRRQMRLAELAPQVWPVLLTPSTDRT